jgi:Capsule polysaccharide biosynthesis protein
MTLRETLRRLLPTAHTQASDDPPDLLAQFRALMATRPPIPPASGQRPVRVGIASFGAGVNHLVVDSLLAHALQRRGAISQLLLCDLPELPGCDERFVDGANNRRCQGDCISAKLPFLEVCGLDWVRLSGFLENPGATLKMAADLVAACPDEKLTSFEYDGCKLGEWLGSSVASFLRSDSHGMDPEVIEARRRYLISGLVASIGSRRWIETWQPDILMVISGRHIFWRAAREIAQARGIKVVSREMFIESFDCHIFAVNSSCEDPKMPRAWAEARENPLTPEQDRVLDENLRGLPAYARQVDYDPVLEARPSAIRTELNLSADRPLIVLFTNVSWDLFVAERDFAFDGQMKWIAATFDFIRRHPEFDLVVRAHPAEIVPKFQTRGRIVQQIEERFAPVPSNVRLIGPESTISSDSLRSMASLNLVYCSSVGMEAIIAGQPVLICGNPYYARKGFTINVDSPSQYDRLLEDHAAGKPVIPPAQSVELARRFLYLFKFRYGIRMGLTSDNNKATALKIQDLRELEPGVSFSLDTACDGILHRDEILLPV